MRRRRSRGEVLAQSEPDWDRLLALACRASRRAYAPYSRLRIGAALGGRRSRTYAGCNVENASFGLTICAERAAVFRAVSQGEREFTGLVIYTEDAAPLSPCGACRQVLAEFCPELRIISVGEGGRRRDFTLRELLPQSFHWRPPEGLSPRRGSSPPAGTRRQLPAGGSTRPARRQEKLG